MHCSSRLIEQKYFVLTLAIVLLFALLSCSFVDGILSGRLGEDTRDDFDVEMDRKQESSLINDNFGGERPYHIAADDAPASSDCFPEYPIGNQVPVSINYEQLGLESDEDKVTIADQHGVRVYERYGSVVPARPPYLFCRTAEIGGVQRLECVVFSDGKGFELQVYGGKILKDEFLCHTTSYSLDKPPVADLPATEEVDELTQEQGPWFSLKDCTCAGLNIPLDEDNSSASKVPHKMTSSSGMEFENIQLLTCKWSEAFESPNSVGQITFSLDMYKVGSEVDARALYMEFRDLQFERPGYCEEDQFCSMAVNDFGDVRGLYAEMHDYLKGGEILLPSMHQAMLGKVIATETEQFFYVEIWTTHPELEMGSPWAIEQADRLETCATNIAHSK